MCVVVWAVVQFKLAYSLIIIMLKKRIDNYTIFLAEKLGGGSFGTVYKGE